MVQQVLGGRYECDLAGDVATARQRLVANGFNLVFCDVQMPGESGLALVEEIAAESEGTAVVPIAGTEDSSLVEHALEIGVYGYLVEPFSPGQLLITAETALRRREAESGRAGASAPPSGDDPGRIRSRSDSDLRQRPGTALSARQPVMRDELMRQEQGGMIGRTDAEMHSPETERVIHEGDMQVLHDGESSFREMTVEIMRPRANLPYRPVPVYRCGRKSWRASSASQPRSPHSARPSSCSGTAGARARAIEELRSSRQEALERMAQAIEMHDSEVGRHVNRMARVTPTWRPARARRRADPADPGGGADARRRQGRDPGGDPPQAGAADARGAARRWSATPRSATRSSRLRERAAADGRSDRLTHHERFDGSGYPQGLHGEEIPIEGRIVAVADVFDALLSDRPTGRRLSIDEAIETIRDGRGTQFDPEVADVLLEHSDAVVEIRG